MTRATTLNAISIAFSSVIGDTISVPGDETRPRPGAPTGNRDPGDPAGEETGRGSDACVEKCIEFGEVLDQQQDRHAAQHPDDGGCGSRSPGEDTEYEQAAETAGKETDDLEPLVEDAVRRVGGENQSGNGPQGSEDDRETASQEQFPCVTEG